MKKNQDELKKVFSFMQELFLFRLIYEFLFLYTSPGFKVKIIHSTFDKEITDATIFLLK